jgi:hypothetical protein
MDLRRLVDLIASEKVMCYESAFAVKVREPFRFSSEVYTLIKGCVVNGGADITPREIRSSAVT